MKNYKFLNIRIFIAAFIIFINLTYIPVYGKNFAQNENVEKNILVIVSSECSIDFSKGAQSIPWQNSIISSMNSVFMNSKENVHVSVQYIDYEQNSESYLKELYNLCKLKYSNSKFDAIVTIDDLNDSAFRFVVNYGKNLFPNTPVVFAGIPYFDKSILKDYPLITGITKNPDIKSTIDLALKLHPGTKEIFIIVDNSVYGIASKKILQSLAPEYKNIKFVFSEETDIYKVKNQINSLPKNTVIYFGYVFKDKNGISISDTTTSDILFKNSNIPMYSRTYVNTIKNSVGGMVTYSEGFGNSIGKLVLRILNGESPSNIPVTEDNSHKYEFNYIQLKKFNINLNSLPKNSVILNKPEIIPYYKDSILKIILIIIVFIIILELFFIINNRCKRKAIEKSLSYNENILRTFINSTPDIIYLKDTENKFLEINDSALSILNITRKELKYINKNNLNNLSDFTINILQHFNINDKKAWKKADVFRYEEKIPNAENKTIKIYDTLRVPVFDEDGKPKSIILLGRDITEHKQNEKNEKIIKELKYYDELRSNFFSNISHELKTPLNLIFSALQFIELKDRNNNDNGLKKYTEIMRQNCYRLLRIIDNLIDITKIDSGNFFMNFENNDIVFIVEHIVMSVVSYVENKGIQIVFDTDTEEKIMAFDLDAMERIILNLLSNAIKFTPKGGKIEINIYDRGDNIVISVKDTGIGIPKEKQDYIFKKFVQVDKSLSRNREGSGLGLSLVKELVLLHNGTVEVKSIPDKGSEFKVILPTKVLPKKPNSEIKENSANAYKIQRIKIEFSDIYDY